MKLALIVATLAVAGCSGCNSPSPPTPQPSPYGPSTPPITDQTVYSELTLAQCMKETDGGLQAVRDLHADGGPTQPQWLACLYGGGTIKGCSVPCDGEGQ